MKPEIYFSLQAELRLEQLLNYLEFTWGENSKNKFLRELIRCTNLIRSNPNTFPFFDPQQKIRGCLVNSYNYLLYIVKNNDIYVLAIWDTRMNKESITDIFK